MTISLKLAPETEQILLTQAKACDLSLDEFLATIIVRHANTSDNSISSDTVPVSAEASSDFVDDVFDTVSVPPGVGQGSMRRENWY